MAEDLSQSLSSLQQKVDARKVAEQEQKRLAWEQCQVDPVLAWLLTEVNKTFGKEAGVDDPKAVEWSDSETGGARVF